MDYQTDSPEQTHAVGVEIGRRLAIGDCVALHGPLGAGKTALTRGLAEGFGADASLVSSPTYVLMQEYPGPAGSLFHLDLYRMTDPSAELEDMDFEGMLAAGAVVIEWAEKAAGILPTRRYDIHLDRTGETARAIRVASPA